MSSLIGTGDGDGSSIGSSGSSGSDANTTLGGAEAGDEGGGPSAEGAAEPGALQLPGEPGATTAGAPDAGVAASPADALAPCGGAGQACCLEGPSCGAQLGCEDGRCVECARFVAVPPPAGAPAGSFSRVSGDGRVVVVNGAASQAYRMVWRSSEAPTLLQPLAEDVTSYATGVSRDGSVAVGTSGGPDGTRATIWAADSVATRLGTLESATSVSADGNVVIGADANGPLRWTASGDVTRIESMQSANDVSADGRSVVGTRQSDTEADRGVLDSGGASTLVGLAAALLSSATLISGDGSVVVGTSIDNVARASIFRWRAGAAEPLEGLSEAHDISGDGSVVVGAASGEECGGVTGIWRQGRPLEHLECILPAGTLPEGWRLLRATGVSDDGRVISGLGINPEAALQSWVASLGPACTAP